MMDEVVRNYFGTFMLLFLPLVMLTPLVKIFAYQTLTFFKYFPPTLSRLTEWLFTSNVLATWSWVVLVIALFRKKWFTPGVEISFWRYVPLWLSALMCILVLIGSLQSLPQAKGDLGLIMLSLLMGIGAMNAFWAFGVYLKVNKSFRAPINSPAGLLFQPFMLPKLKGKMRLMGSFLTVATLIAPNYYVFYFVSSRSGFLVIDLGLKMVVLGGAVTAAIVAFKLFCRLGSHPDQQHFPALHGTSAILAPVLFLAYCVMTEQMMTPVLYFKTYSWMSWLEGVDRMGVFCGVYLVGGLVGYVAYLLPRSNPLSRAYRVFEGEEQQIGESEKTWEKF